ncbi:MAG: electron transfer flavoprotein subunit alpha/FixB family protein [Cytophagaceae bacterium]|nr:electron transfer flavoprotein subunit alpha/FixB family protein [Cytophagaceae bacterium]MBL0303482.1 electron transfer flavoprotein subunit alpha/FixB family protein [Cytophagaceae bacterium]MBL0326308.1 electron transfer flavoprotein subunit alpha/FixB family protein [Cytophagaceae bacterium]
MSILIFTELADGKFKKSSLEAISYGSKVDGSAPVVLAIGEAGEDSLAEAGQFGASKVIYSPQNQENIMVYSQALLQAIESTGAIIVVSVKSALADAVMARAAGTLKAALIGNVTELPDTSNGFVVKNSIFSGKAFAKTEMKSEVKFLQIKKNVVEAIPQTGSAVVETVNFATDNMGSKVIDTQKASGQLSLPEADIVVSGGRGMKGPEHWQPLLDLAQALGAATGCSKPVSDLDWRPHHEHVGQTGVKVAPNLYIACGISGAIQHLAGVNSSKVIVVINKDPEAPFFKAADYGIVGDVFEVLPKLTEAAKLL